jgi:hypothetical protein
MPPGSIHRETRIIEKMARNTLGLFISYYCLGFYNPSTSVT